MTIDSPYYEKAFQVMQNSLLFQDVDDIFLHEILGWFELNHLKKGAIIDPEETLHWMYMPIEGRVKASQVNVETAKEYIISLLSPGDIFDVIALMEKREHPIILEAIDDVDLLRVNADATRKWLDDHPEFNKNFLPYLGQRMRYLEENASDLALHDTETRLAKLILRNLDKRQSSDKEHQVKLINDLSDDLIAKMIGSVRAVVNRSIQKLKSDEVLESSSYKEKRVKNLQELIRRCKHALYDKKNKSIK